MRTPTLPNRGFVWIAHMFTAVLNFLLFRNSNYVLVSISKAWLTLVVFYFARIKKYQKQNTNDKLLLAKKG